MQKQFRSDVMNNLDCLVKDAMNIYLLTAEEQKKHYVELLGKALEFKSGSYKANKVMALGEADADTLLLLGKYIKENIKKG